MNAENKTAEGQNLKTSHVTIIYMSAIAYELTKLFKNISCYYYINELIKSKALKSKFKNISCYYYIFANLIFMC